MELLEKLGIDWRLFVAQIINFLALLFVLYLFLYKPVLGLLERRRETIEKSLADAKKIEELAAKAEAATDAKMREVRKEAARILEEAERRAEALREEKLMLTKKDMEKIIEQSKAQLAYERESILREVKEEAGELVTSAVATILEGLPHEKIDKALIEGSLKKIKSR